MTTFSLNRTMRRAGLLAVAGAAMALGMGRIAPTPALAQARTTAKPVINLLCKFPDKADSPRTVDQMQEKFGGNLGGLDDYFRQMSDQTINLRGTQTRGWYTLPQNQSAYDGNSAMTACATAANADVDFSKFTMVNMFFNDLLGAPTGGVDWNIGLDGVTSIAYTRNDADAGNHVIQHEMTHAFGLYYYHSTNDPYDIISDPHSYTSAFDRRGALGLVGPGMIATNRDHLGWISPARKVSVGTGSQQVTLTTLSHPDSRGTLMAEIPFGSTGLEFYTVEYRRTTDYDQNLPVEGVLIHHMTETELQGMYFLDSVSVASMLSEGQTFTGDGGISIHVDKMGGPQTTITVTRTGPAPLPRPSSFPQTPPNFRTTGSTNSSVSLAWDVAANHTDEHTFRVEMTPGWNGDAVTEFYGRNDDRTATINWLTQGQTYTFRIKSCIYQSTSCSAYSSAVTATAGTAVAVAPATPTNFRSTASTSSTIDLAWDSPAASDVTFDIAYYGSNGRTHVYPTATQRSVTISGLQSGPQYDFTIRACRGDACSDNSATVTARATGSTPPPTPSPTPSPTPTATPAPTRTPTPTATPATPPSGGATAPGTPANLSTTQQGSTSVTLAWNAPSGTVTSYVVSYRRFNAGQSSEVTVAAPTLSAAINSLSAGTWYQFKVKACNSSACSAFTDEIALTTYAS